MSGTYTVGWTGFDFKSPTHAADSIKARGVKGPVVFLIEDGSYSTQIEFPNSVKGASSKNTITFKGKSGNRKLVIFKRLSQPCSFAYQL